MGEDFREVGELPTPFELAVVSHLSHRHPGKVFHLGQFGRIGLGGRAVDLAGSETLQSFVRALPVELLTKASKRRCCSPRVCAGGWMALPSATGACAHPARSRSVGPGESPTGSTTWLGQMAQAPHCQRSKRRPVVGAHGLGQPMFPKHPLHPRPSPLPCRYGSIPDTATRRDCRSI